MHKCLGICWWNAIPFLKRKDSHSKGILWYVLLFMISYNNQSQIMLALLFIFWLSLSGKTVSAVIYPSLRQLEGEFIELEDFNTRSQYQDVLSKKRGEYQRKLSGKNLERDDECGICMENCTKMVLPNCGHSMCICCFHDWYHQFAMSLSLQFLNNHRLTGYDQLKVYTKYVLEFQECTVTILPFLPQ